MTMDSVDARRAAKICGFKTVAMLDYLERSGILVRKKSAEKRRGKGRRYNFRELLVLKVISSLLDNGASVSALKKSLIEFQDGKWTADRASLGLDNRIIRYLSVSAGNILYADSNNNFFDMTMKGQMVFSFIIDLDNIHTQLCSDLDQREFLFGKV
jgi:DNA-binding transcriptional MerR regulator